MPQLVPSAANRPESNAFHCQKDVHRQSFHFDTDSQHTNTQKDVHRQSFHFDTEGDTGPAYTQVQIQPARRGPLDPLTTAVLDQPPGRAAKRLAPHGRLKRDLNKRRIFISLGDLLPDPLRVAHLRRSCELLRDTQAKFSFRHRRGHRTGIHTGANSTPLEGPWTPLQQPYSISRRAGPRNA